jgi:hypothetical protein
MRIDPDFKHDVRAYAQLVKQIKKAALSPLSPVSANAATQMIDVVSDGCVILTLHTIEDATMAVRDPLDDVRARMTKGEATIAALEAAMAKVDLARLASQKMLGTADQHSEGWYVVDEGVTETPRSLVVARAEAVAEYVGDVLTVMNDMLASAASLPPGAPRGRPKRDNTSDADTYFALNAKRKMALIDRTAMTLTGETLANIARASIDPYRLFTALDQATEEELLLLQQAYHLDRRVTPADAAGWDDLIGRTIRLQRMARADPAKFMVWMFRDESRLHKGKVLDVQPFQAAWFDAFNDPRHLLSLVMAPTGHGKSTVVRANDLWYLGHHPETRLLIVTDVVDKAEKEIRVLMKAMKSGWYRAIFPNIRVLGVADKVAQGNDGFTVAVAGQSFAREQTVEGCALDCNPNGNRYDKIRFDDWFSNKVRWQDGKRDRANEQFDSVFMRRLDIGGRVNAVCTPWHPDDPAGRIRKSAEADAAFDWLVRIFRIERDEQKLPIPLWPDRVGRQELIRLSHGESFGCTHEMAPERNIRRSLRRLCFYSVETGEGLDPPMPLADRQTMLVEQQAACHGERWLSIDPASSELRAACDIACGKFTLAENGRLYLRQAYWFRTGAGSLQRWVLQQITGEALFAERWIEPDDEHQTKIDKLRRAEQKVIAAGDIDQVLMETGGPQTGQFNLMRQHVEEGLTAMGVIWNGTIQGRTPAGEEGRSLVSKEIRFDGCSGLIANGFVKFPGRPGWIVEPDTGKPHIQNVALAAGENDDVAKLLRQILNFPAGSKDGVDMLTQLVLWLRTAGRLGLGAAVQEARAQENVDPMTAAVRAAVAMLLQGTNQDSQEMGQDETEWTLELSAA